MTISGLFGHNFRQTKRVKDMECGHCGMWTCVKVNENEKKMSKCGNVKTCQDLSRFSVTSMVSRQAMPPCHGNPPASARSLRCVSGKRLQMIAGVLSLSLCALSLSVLSLFLLAIWNSKAKIPRWLVKCCSECLLSLKCNGSGAPLFQLCSCCCFPKESI